MVNVLEPAVAVDKNTYWGVSLERTLLQSVFHYNLPPDLIWNI
jgi:hypothetical protein